MLGRETPVYILQYLILSFGGQYILQDELPDDQKEHDKVMKKVTHMCMDRPAKQIEKGREYVQPQYILDSINNLFLLPTKPYLPGVPAPAHLSPFINDATTGYVPDRQREINSLAGIETAANVEEFSSDSEQEKEGENKAEDREVATKGDLDSSSDEEADDLGSASEDEKPTKAKMTKIQKQLLSKKDKEARNDKIKKDLQKEKQELGKMLMTQRQRKIFEKEEASHKKKKEATKKLLEKKKQISKKK